MGSLYVAVALILSCSRTTNPLISNKKNLMKQEDINKSIVRDFYRRAVSQGDIAFAEEIVADDYIQHSSAVKPGKAGLLEALHYMKQMPKPATTSTPFMRLLAEGDYVVTNMSFGWDGKQKVVVDIFRFRAGQVVEHWDALQDQPETTLNGHAMMDGDVAPGDADLAVSNKAVVKDFYQRVFVNKQLEAMSDFVAPDLIQHCPEISNGLIGLKDYLAYKSDSMSIEKIDLLIGEGNFVVVQSEGKLNQKNTTFYDVFRLTDGKIVEHWGVKQISL
ncbi:Predicted SnoaL-like aldol condensation-catalyzing enzyme [Spirosoma endophyticum]|uniref:Predicted SnoaL-like aldol condensation-catalyzing enzyme n=2 Tax=Spirosoma endophyticum TaxID=662367 RepID=A0A1I2H6Z6_9BACT|nr:Predicted SnoaL-like aldol condensation-catalyzing enzyme [Spirosoma endophyticum]